MNRKTFKYSFLASVSVMAGYVVLGAGFGMLLFDKGYSFWWAILMSCTIYAGSMQFVAVDLLATGASLISTALMTLLVNARHLFYGISMVESYRDMGWRKLYVVFGLTDETYSLVCGEPKLPEGVDRKAYYFTVTLLDQCYWVFGSFLGGFLGSALDINTAGIEFSMTALFVIIFVEQWEKTKQHLPALMGLGISVICLLIFGAGDFLIPSMIGIVIALFAMQKVIQGEAVLSGGREVSGEKAASAQCGMQGETALAMREGGEAE